MTNPLAILRDAEARPETAWRNGRASFHLIAGYGERRVSKAAETSHLAARVFSVSEPWKSRPGTQQEPHIRSTTGATAGQLNAEQSPELIAGSFPLRVTKAVMTLAFMQVTLMNGRMWSLSGVK